MNLRSSILISFMSTAAVAQTPRLCGTTFYSSDCFYGNITELRSDSIIINRHRFNCDDGAYPNGNLIQLSDGKLYGTCSVGGFSCTGVPDDGKLFSFDMTDSNYTVLATFSGSYGREPCHSVLAASNNKLYGMTASAGIGYGTIYSFDLSNSLLTTVHYFDGVNGAYPANGLIEDDDGKLYGLTTYGGQYSKGVLFSLDTISDNFIKLHDFDSLTGIEPFGKLLMASNGKLYGTSCHGGAHNAGVLFSYDIDSNLYNVVIEFDISNGKCPQASPIQASDGKIYVVCAQGGNDSLGTLLRYDIATSTPTKLFDFNNISGKPGIHNDIFQASNGLIYGMTQGAGAVGIGTIYKFDPVSYAFTKLYDFGLANGDGGASHSSFIELQSGTAINEISNSIFSIYPNPTPDRILVKVNSEKLNNSMIIILNSLGETVLQSNIQVSASEFNIDLRKLPSGIYFLQIRSTDRISGCKKVIKL